MTSEGENVGRTVYGATHDLIDWKAWVRCGYSLGLMVIVVSGIIVKQGRISSINQPLFRESQSVHEFVFLEKIQWRRHNGAPLARHQPQRLHEFSLTHPPWGRIQSYPMFLKVQAGHVLGSAACSGGNQTLSIVGHCQPTSRYSLPIHIQRPCWSSHQKHLEYLESHRPLATENRTWAHIRG